MSRIPHPPARMLLRIGSNVVPIGRREAGIARLLLTNPAGLTRMDMLRAGSPGLALGAPGYVSRLRKAGAPIESVPVNGTDASGAPVRFVRYRLAGRVEITREPWPMPEAPR